MASDHKGRGLRNLETLLSLLMHPKPEDACLEMCCCDGIGRAERLEHVALDSRRVTHGVIQDGLHQVHLSAARRTLHRPALALEPGRAE
jgi:hypothetical protein